MNRFMVFLLFPVSMYAQNLIPNSGFDSLLPYSEFEGGISASRLAVPWESAGSSPDLYNTNFMGTGQIPFFGGLSLYYQKQLSGNGFAGILTYFDVLPGWNEYLRTPLISPLKTGQSYYIRFFVSPRFNGFTGSTFADGLGLAFIAEKNEVKDYHTLLPLSAAIRNTKGVLSDTANWTSINGCYTAKGDERYAVIGNFWPNKDLTVMRLGDGGAGAYTYIEDVFVGVFNPLPDTVVVCATTPLYVDATFPDVGAYQWSNGDTTAKTIIEQSGRLIVTAQMENCVLRDTTFVIKTETADLPSDTIMCKGETLILKAPLPGHYQWSTGATTASLAITREGTYTIAINNDCGPFDFTTKVTAKECGCPVFVPNVFSPNGDGEHDDIEVTVRCDYPMQRGSFTIFDRWGSITANYKDGETIFWDGHCQGKPCPEGVYTWLFEYQFFKNGQWYSQQKQGTIAIVR